MRPDPKYRRVFTNEEDYILRRALEMHDRNDWVSIASNLPGRSPRQCRERWVSFLSPDVNRTPWTSEEDGLLFDLLQATGPRWCSLTPFFRHRTHNNIKNRWNTVVRKARTLGLEPGSRASFIEAGKKVASRTRKCTFELPESIPVPSPQEFYSLENLLNRTPLWE
jgi:hypothetical protein